MYTNQRSMRKTPTVVSRLFQHSPRQLRIARERLDKVELNPAPKREPADPHSLGRDKHEAEVRVSQTGHASTRYIPVPDNLVGSGAVVQPNNEEQRQREPIETPHVKSSLHMEGGFFQTTFTETQNNSRKMCEGSAHGAQGHLDGASATHKKPSRSSIMPSDAEGWWETDDAVFHRPLRGAGDPSFGAAHIQNMTDYLGAGKVDYKPTRRQIEHAGAEMHDAMQGPPAVLDLHGRPWVQKQRQHFSAEELAGNVDRNVSANVKEVAENFRFEEHAHDTKKRVPQTAGGHPISEDFPLYASGAIARQQSRASGAQYMIDPFGKLSVCHAESGQSKRVAKREEAAPPPWDNIANVDSVMHDPACKALVSADRRSACTGLWPQRRHASTHDAVLRGTYAAIELARPLAQPPWEVGSSDQASPTAFRDDIRSGHATADRAARPTTGRGTTPERERRVAEAGLGASGSPWNSELSMEYQVSQSQDWMASNPLHAVGQRRSRRSAEHVVLNAGAAGKALAFDGAAYPASGHRSLRHDPATGSILQMTPAAGSARGPCGATATGGSQQGSPSKSILLQQHRDPDNAQQWHHPDETLLGPRPRPGSGSPTPGPSPARETRPGRGNHDEDDDGGGNLNLNHPSHDRGSGSGLAVARGGGGASPGALSIDLGSLNLESPAPGLRSSSLTQTAASPPTVAPSFDTRYYDSSQRPPAPRALRWDPPEADPPHHDDDPPHHWHASPLGPRTPFPDHPEPPPSASASGSPRAAAASASALPLPASPGSRGGGGGGGSDFGGTGSPEPPDTLQPASVANLNHWQWAPGPTGSARPGPAGSRGGGGGSYSSGAGAGAGISTARVWAASRRAAGRASGAGPLPVGLNLRLSSSSALALDASSSWAVEPAPSLRQSVQSGGLKPAWWGSYDAGADPEPAPGRITPANSSRAERRRSRSATPTQAQRSGLQRSLSEAGPALESDTWFKGGRRASFTSEHGTRVHKNASSRGNLIAWDTGGGGIPNPQLTPRSGKKLVGTQVRNQAQWDIDSCQKGRRLSLDSHMSSHYRGGYGAGSAPFGVDLRY